MGKPATTATEFWTAYANMFTTLTSGIPCPELPNTLHLQRLPVLLCLRKLRDHVLSRFSPGLQPASKQCQVQLLPTWLTGHELVGQILQVIITCTCFEMPSLFLNRLTADSSHNIVSINVTHACSSSYQGKKETPALQSALKQTSKHLLKAIQPSG